MVLMAIKILEYRRPISHIDKAVLELNLVVVSRMSEGDIRLNFTHRLSRKIISMNVVHTRNMIGAKS
jgi:hypothetical protein